MPIYKKFTDSEVSLLKKTFKNASYYPSKKIIKNLSKSLKSNSLKIENWFKYNRRKLYFDGEFQGYKVRKTFNDDELIFLNSHYKSNKNPDLKECQSISIKMKGISGYQIKNWFANQRRKLKNNLNIRKDVDDETMNTLSDDNKKKEYKYQRNLTKMKLFSQTRSKIRKISIMEKNEEIHNQNKIPHVKLEETSVEASKKIPIVEENVEKCSFDRKLTGADESFDLLQNAAVKSEWNAFLQQKYAINQNLQNIPLINPAYQSQQSYFNYLNMRK